ncbi:MAG: hypothetical protein AAGD25_31550 [Cyanobacteria bacterium P01_F01_bin.150]
MHTCFFYSPLLSHSVKQGRSHLLDRPITVTNKITDFGRTALGFLKKLKDWVEQHQL